MSETSEAPAPLVVEITPDLSRAMEAFAEISRVFQERIVDMANKLVEVASYWRRLDRRLGNSHLCHWREAGHFDVCRHGRVVRYGGKSVLHNGRKPR